MWKFKQPPSFDNEVAVRACRALTGFALAGLIFFPTTQSFAQPKPTKLNFASYAGPTWAGSKASEWWANEINKRTNGRVKIEFFYAESLLAVRDTIRGVGDGRADIGVTSVAYHPSELPLSQVSNIPFVTKNGEATMAALGELYTHNKALHNEFERNNVHVLYYQALGETPIGAKQQIPNLAWLKGKKVRAIGYTGKALDVLGASPVAITYPELYESMQRDVVSAYTTVAFSAVTDIKLQEVAPFAVDAGIGEFGMVVVVMNKDKWDSLPADVRQVFDQVNKEHSGKLVELLESVEADVCRQIKAAGGSVTPLSEEDTAAWKKQIGTSIVDLYKSSARKRGVKDVDAFYDAYLADVKKFEATATLKPGLSKCARE